MSSVVEAIAAGARAESEVWAAALRPEPSWQPVFSPLAPPALALGLETVYEAYLTHYGTPRLFEPPDADEAVLLGDYLYAHGLVRIEEVGTVEAVSDLAELIALCAYLCAEGIVGDGPVWAATAASLGRGDLDEGRSSLRLDNDPSPLERLARSRVGDAATDAALATHRVRLR
jgi:hypothetical protein